MSTLSSTLADRLEQRDARGLKRDLTAAADVRARTQFVSDLTDDWEETAWVFASNNYLGLATDDRVQAAAARAADEVGTGAGASRLVTGDTACHRRLETALADAKATEDALVFSSGYAANVGTITALDPDLIFSDELNHASIIDGCRLTGETVVYDHCDPTDLERKLEAAQADRGPDETWLIVTDSVFSMDGDVAPLAALCELAEQYDAWLMVDEAHATGLYGDGGGIVQRERLADRVDIQMGTLSKALGSQGGYVAGSDSLITYLVNEARSFVYSTGLAPPAAAAACEALQIARTTDRADRLWDRVDRLRTGLEELGYEVRGETQILPIIVGDRETALALGGRLREAGIVAPAIRPPTVPEGTSRIRLSPMATHSEKAIDACLEAFATVGREVGVIDG